MYAGTKWMRAWNGAPVARVARTLLFLVVVAVSAARADVMSSFTHFGGMPVIAAASTAQSVAPGVPAGESDAVWQYPETRSLGVNRIVIHAPQIRSWEDFSHFEGILAVEFFPHTAPGKPLYATLKITGATRLEVQSGLVVITNPEVVDVMFASGGTRDYVAQLKTAVRSNKLEVPLDLFLASLDEKVLEGKSSEGFNTAAPDIVVSPEPAILLHIPGQPFRARLEETALELVVNANWPLLYDPASGRWFLLYRDLWLTAQSPEGVWTATRRLPNSLNGLSPEGEHAALLAAIPAPRSELQVPRVFYASEPAELLVIQGEPDLHEVFEGGGLYHVANAWGPLFRYGNQWYFPVAGRWFVSTSLAEDAAWEMSPALPDAFSEIPTDHKLAYLRASVPGTPESRLAALEAILPYNTTVSRSSAPAIEVLYDGEPDFQMVASTGVSRAVNSPQDVLELAGVYYLCYEGVWYSAARPQGPWIVTADVPDAIYGIPPDSPSYPVTDVTVDSSTTDNVTYTSTQAYASNTYVYNGVPVYSTGWLYLAYIGSFYYPHYPSYGYGRYYNPNTGTYGSRSVWYGPYGGYSYGRGYNPDTGRYGYRETAWDGDEFASYSEVYSERRDTKTTTERYWDDDDGRGQMERTVERGDDWIQTERTINVADGWSETQRETSRGGSSEMGREWDENGNMQSSGTITTGDGRTAQISGDYEDGEGTSAIRGSEGGGGSIDRSVDGDTVTREGEFATADGDSFSSSTKREGDRRMTEIAGSGGGEIKSVAEDGSRVSVGKNAEGDLYAGHDGNVFKKTDDGWEQYNRDSGDWSAGDAGQGAATSKSGAGAERQVRPPAADQSAQQDAYGRGRDEMSQVNRDAAARSRGYQRSQQRTSRTPMRGRTGRRRGR